MDTKKIVFSGVKPTGELQLGNYIGSVSHWEKMQSEYNCIYSIVDMHSITVRQSPAVLRRRAMDVLKYYIACGLDPEKSIVYFQSHVSAHAELAWVLNCFTYVGELNRMTQYKEKSQKNADNINAGLFTYPVLMASDILLFNVSYVPVGEDQKQHVEITRDIAERFNNIYGEVFTIPEPIIDKAGARIMGLQNPTKKMSKSDDAESTEKDLNNIFLCDEPNVILNKIKRAVTDSGSEVKFSDEKPGVSNLLTIYCCLTNKKAEEAEADFAGKGYGDFKKAVAEVIIETLLPIQKKAKDLENNKDYLESIIKSGAEKASYMAHKTLRKVYKKVGFVSKPF